jgi:hypothetical protein
MIVQFIGGPLDGQQREMAETPLDWLVPVPPDRRVTPPPRKAPEGEETPRQLMAVYRLRQHRDRRYYYAFLGNEFR